MPILQANLTHTTVGLVRNPRTSPRPNFSDYLAADAAIQVDITVAIITTVQVRREPQAHLARPDSQVPSEMQDRLEAPARPEDQAHPERLEHPARLVLLAQQALLASLERLDKSVDLDP